ncbi:hypothetical protein IGI04_007601 [Brassica rapa subsp. trilocularis]|uniref:CCHC-type domain-containing protein n=1 Tax=Brassica rapa subsp. trilocularis TaxID=1813537 RepID=A0ABQ7NK66_BRACM|nr:hypothetical protein IGI04_007601 [Brassica rapa subsp. trilocularis]
MKQQPLRFSPETQNLAKPCPVGERAAAGHQTTTGATASHQSTAGDRVISPERRSRRVLIPSHRFLESSTIFLLDPATGEGFGWKPTLVLVDLVSSRKCRSDRLGVVLVFGMAPRGRRTARGRGTATRVVREASPTNSVESVNGTNTETDGGSSTKGSQQSDQPAGYAEMMAELQRYRERFGDQMREESADGTPHQADARGYVPGVGEIGLEEESKLTRSTQSKATKRTWEVANTPQAAKSEGGATCHRCNKKGHHVKDCRFPPNVRCYRCNREGHTSNACRMPAQGAPQQGAPQQGAGRNKQLPPPPKRQDVAGRAFVVGDHEGGEPIVEKTLGFSPSSSIKRRQPLRFSPETQNLAKPCPVGERAAAGHQTTTGATASHRSTAGDRVISPERRSRRVLIPSHRFLESSTIFLLDPATGEGFGWKPTLVLVDLVSKDL